MSRASGTVSAQVARMAGVLCFLPLLAGTPPPEVVGGLGAEAYPERVAAERSLADWARKEGEEGLDWLIRNARLEGDPELSTRCLGVLKLIVLGTLEQDRPGFVGIQMQSPRFQNDGPRTDGVLVAGVVEDSPAEESGLLAGDLIVKIDGQGWRGGSPLEEFATRVGGRKAGTKVTLELLRSEETLRVDLTLAPRPWSLGVYDPSMSPGRVVPNESDARDEVFFEWLAAREATAGRDP